MTAPRSTGAPTCRRCGALEPVVTPYWSKDGHQLCLPCCEIVAAQLDERDAWPPVPWSDEEEVLLDG